MEDAEDVKSVISIASVAHCSLGSIKRPIELTCTTVEFQFADRMAVQAELDGRIPVAAMRQPDVDAFKI